MAVERADALLSDPKIEDEHPESTSMRGLDGKMCRCAPQNED
jgi:hypothetical protein